MPHCLNDFESCWNSSSRRISASIFHLCMKKPRASEARPKWIKHELSGRDEATLFHDRCEQPKTESLPFPGTEALRKKKHFCQISCLKDGF